MVGSLESLQRDCMVQLARQERQGGVLGSHRGGLIQINEKLFLIYSSFSTGLWKVHIRHANAALENSSELPISGVEEDTADNVLF